ncbi:hypothetical protein AOLI_G00191060 [Acnodon oligacanthus]
MRLMNPENVNFLLILILQSVPGVRCETEELNYTAYEGGQVRIRCPYKPGYTEKYFCKGDAKIPFEGRQSSRFLLHDNTSAHIFTLNITQLDLEDKGTYWCVRRGNSSSDICRTKIQLDVKPELTCELGQNVSIQCHYNPELRNSVKFLCKGQNTLDCAERGVKITSEQPKMGPLSLSDDASAGVFTVTIAGLKEEDSGTYWCGGSTGLEHVFISSVDLDIFQDAEPSRGFSKPTKPKDRFTTKTQLDSSTNSVHNVTFVVLTLPSPLTPKSESGNFVLSISSVAVGILLFGVITYSFLRWTQKKRARGSSAEVEGGNNTRLPPPAADYEEIKDVKDHPDTHNKASTAELLTDPLCSPTDQADGLDYAMVTLHLYPNSTDQTGSLDYSTVTFWPNSFDCEVHAPGEMCTYSTVSHPQSE